MKKIFYTVLSFMVTAGSFLPGAVYAQDSTNAPKPSGRPLRRIEQRVKSAARGGRANIGTGQVTANNSTSLTVTKDGTTYTVNIGTFTECKNQATKIVRRFGGTVAVSEIQVNDKVNVVGKFTDSTKTAVNACIVRDTTLSKRNGVIVGSVTALTSTGWTMTTARDQRGPQTVVISGSPKLVDRKGNTIAQADVLVGHKVRVKGVWDAANKTMAGVTEVKDYSLPLRTTVTPTPTATQ